MAPKPHLCALERLFFTFVEDRFVVWLSRAEEVEDDSGELVCGSCDGLWLSKLAANAAEELSHVVFGMVQRAGR